jgi:microcin C transport system ATP-binding protein
MRDGIAVEQGPAEQVFGHPKRPYTRELMAAAFDFEATGPGPVGGETCLD